MSSVRDEGFAIWKICVAREVRRFVDGESKQADVK